ncbi:MAG: TrkH family potassium uptake protein [Oscillospiraceae bacterium]|jgi:trk system potassium uptake protein TrkH
MNKRIVFHTVGLILMIESGLLLLPCLVALIYSDPNGKALFLSAVITFAAGLCLRAIRTPDSTVYAREGFAIVAFSWILMSVFGTLPFLLSGAIPNFLDAFFETVSGFTTTGSTVLTEVEPLGYALLFWRSFTHWVGGMGVLVLVLVVLPLGGQHNIHIVRAEVPGPTSDKLVPKMRSSARILYEIYFVMTLLEIILLRCGGMPLFDCFINAFGSAGTGGFSNHTASVGYYRDLYSEMVIGVFMLLFGVNFNLYYLLLIHHVKEVFRSEELRTYLGIVVFAVLTIGWNIRADYGSYVEALRYSFFQVSAIITTTGFTTANFDLWPQYSRMLLLLLMFIGACASSTGGGIKVSRIILLFRTAHRGVRQSLRPRTVATVHMDGRPVEENVLTACCNYLLCYVFIAAASLLLISLDNFSFDTNFASMVSCLNNIGPGLDATGPVGSFGGYSPFSKLVLCFDMLAGRLEIIPMLAIFAPSVWKNNARRLPHGAKIVRAGANEKYL